MRNQSEGAPSDAPPSKSQLKRDARERFELGRRLVELPSARLAELPLEPELREAVDFARSIRARTARKRQLGYLARLLRGADVAPLLKALERQQDAARQLHSRHHRAEAWRDLLLSRGDEVLAVLADARRDVAPQAIRTLIRNARREAERGKPPVSARRLFSMLRELDETEPLPDLEDPR